MVTALRWGLPLASPCDARSCSAGAALNTIWIAGLAVRKVQGLHVLVLWLAIVRIGTHINLFFPFAGVLHNRR